MRRSSSIIVDIVRRSSSVIASFLLQLLLAQCVVLGIVRRSSSVIVGVSTSVRRFFFSYCWRSASFLLQLLLT